MLDSHRLNVLVVFHLRKRFSQRIGYIIICANLTNSDFTFGFPFPYHVKSPLHVFDLLVLSRLPGLSDSSIVITIEVYRPLDWGYNTKFVNEPANPNSFLGSFWSGQVLGFSCRVCSGALLGTLPAKRSSIQTEYVPRLWLEVVSISLEASVGVTFNNQFFVASIHQEFIIVPFQVLKDVLGRSPMRLSWVRLVSARCTQSIRYIWPCTYHGIHDRSD